LTLYYYDFVFKQIPLTFVETMFVVDKICAISMLFHSVYAMSGDWAKAERTSMISPFKLNGTAQPKI